MEYSHNQKLVENFVRRFAQSATLQNTYQIDIYDVSETPPKVSLKVSTKKSTTATNEVITFDLINKLDAIMETPY